jgi:hypothetical protein
MRTVFLLFFLALLIGCSGEYKNRPHEKLTSDGLPPLRLLIINPHGARITDSLNIYADSIEQKLRMKYGFESYNYKYFHFVSDLSSRELQTLFEVELGGDNNGTRENLIEISAIDREGLLISDFVHLGERYEVDYIITFEDIHTAQNEGIPTIKFTTTLFSTKHNVVILKKEIEGNAPVNNFKYLHQIYSADNRDYSRFHESGIHCDNYLECMFRSAVRFSTEDLYNSIMKDLGRN